MFDLEGQESKKVPYCHDHPPQYDSCQPSPDLLTSVIENEHDVRMLAQRLDILCNEFYSFAKNTPSQTDYPRIAEFCLEISRLFAEGVPIGTELANLFKECTDPNTELYIAMSRLTQSEFDRTYASLRRDPNR